MEYLIIGPGAMGIFSMLGYLKTIENKLDNIKEYSGASAGAIICLMLALGFSIDDILYKLALLDGNKLVKLNLKCFMNRYGLVDLKPIRETFVEVLESDPSFSDIEKKIYISAFCVNTSKTVYFSNTKNGFYSIDISGGILNWKQDVNSEVRPIVIGNLIFTITTKGNLTLIDKRNK